MPTKLTEKIDRGGGQTEFKPYEDPSSPADLVACFRGHLFGARLNYVSAASVSVGTAGESSWVKDSTNVLLMTWSGLLTADITVSGAGGLDTGSEAADTLYYVHIIGDTSGTNTPKALISLSATAPTMPSGYDVFRRLGAFRNDGSSDILWFWQAGAGRDRWMYYGEDESQTTVLSAGSATTFTDVDSSAYVPSTSRLIDFHPQYETAGGAASDTAIIKPKGAQGSSTKLGPGVVTGFRMRTTALMACDSSQLIEYKTSAAASTLTLNVRGYLDE